MTVALVGSGAWEGAAVPPARKQRVFAAPVLGPFKPIIDAMLREDLDAPRKQRHTARRVLARLVDEHAVTNVSYSTVRDYVARRRPEIAAEAGRALEAGCVPQTHPPAAEAEVDFHDLWVWLRGVKTKSALFTMRLSCSARAAHRVTLSQGQEAFLEGHVHAFDRLGGVPTDKIRYDNLKPACRGCCSAAPGSRRNAEWRFAPPTASTRSTASPGTRAAMRRAASKARAAGSAVTIACQCQVDSIAELSALLEAWDDADDARRVGNRTRSVGQDWAIERPLLRPLPDEQFDTTLTLTPRVDRYAQVLELDHYLEILLRKPGALPRCDRTVQARAARVFTAEHEAFWAAARKQLGDPAGTRALIESCCCTATSTGTTCSPGSPPL